MNNVLKVRRIAWVCVFFCILYFCYAVYNLMFRDYNFLNSVYSKVIFYAPVFLNICFCVFLLVFWGKVISKIKSGVLFVSNNHIWLYWAALCTFIDPIFLELWRLHIGNFELDWSLDWYLVLALIFKPGAVLYMINGMILLIFAWLYKLGENIVEDQRLTI